MTQRFEVEVVYALPEKQYILPLLVKAGVCVREVIALWRVHTFSELDLDQQKLASLADW